MDYSRYNKSYDRRSRCSGFSLIEIVVYVSLFSLLMVVSLNSIIFALDAFSNLRVSRDMNDSSVSIIERLTRDIKSANSIDLVNSTFGTNPGRLTLNTVNASGTAVTVEYVIIGSVLHLKENGVDQGSLMSAKTKIDALVFYYINTGGTIGIKTELHLTSQRGSQTNSEHFYNTSLMRGTY